MDFRGNSTESTPSIELECNENIQFCGYTRLIVTRGLLSRILFCFIFALFSALIQFVAFKHLREAGLSSLYLTIHKQSPADVGSCVHGMEFVCWNSSGDTLRCGGGLGLATLRVLNVVQTIVLITPAPSGLPALCSDVSVSNICNGREGQFKCPHTPLRYPPLWT